MNVTPPDAAEFALLATAALKGPRIEERRFTIATSSGVRTSDGDVRIMAAMCNRGPTALKIGAERQLRIPRLDVRRQDGCDDTKDEADH